MNILKAAFIASLALAPASALAGVMTVEFNNGESLGDWSVDRAAPAGFGIVNNQLELTIDGSTQGAFGSGFKDTRGMQMDIDRSNFLSIDMYVDADWTGSNRYGGIWGIGHDGADATAGWPIIEYQGDAGFMVWDNNGWHAPLSASYTVGAFNTLSFFATGSEIQYYLNDQLIYTDTSGDVDHFGGVILNAKNEGNDYTVVYDNLTYGTVPEPAPLALLGLGLAGLGLARKRRG